MVKKERTDQIEAFEIYFSLGASRSLTKLHLSLTHVAPAGQKVPSLRTLKEWSRKNNWQDRCMLKDIAIADIADKKGISSAIERKAHWLSLIEARIKTAFSDEGEPKFNVEEYTDLHASIKLGLALLGEPEEKEVEHTAEIKIIRVKPNERDD